MEVVTFGESMVLFYPDATGPLRYATSFRKTIAGAESNVAIAMARLGHSVGWFSKLGEDEFGRYILSVIRGEGVDVSRVLTDSNRNTGLLFKERFGFSNPNIYYYRKDSAASRLSPEDLDASYISKAKVLHITGITPALSTPAQEAVFEAIRIAKENNVIVSFDPNIRLKLWDIETAKPVLLEIASKADILLIGEDEGELLAGTNGPEELAKTFMSMGCTTVVVKLGKRGCYVENTDTKDYIEGYLIEKVEDTVGAGDGFAAGFLSGILRGLSLQEAAEYGNGVGAMATLVSGDMEGFPTYNQLMTFIGKRGYIDR
ncbi:5-dehydro-2-deoxygluconokinase [Geosporobacter subterraneus DSM 17957]|uniref:5-dehydro-2-deoxygluconokinase n=1 Tax=Geosporobacter subterraneus DSM 17957 TaxID=1121919 RepID=A0A1M6KYL5_9FIRM|nr:sugar kinase [Geosporobacter subterraneus]SHJ63979.1 5-dehydro-2-deoxygluconokinase [Geosporobacter subterraneus DSM 17957]